MIDHYSLNDEQFETLFATAEFPSELFNHEAHLRLAYIHIQKYGLEIAEQNITEQLISYVSKLGASDKFHLTLTVASVKAIDHFMRRTQTDNFSELIQKHPGLNTHFKELIQSHYKEDIFNSEEARKRYMTPSLQDFD